MEILIDTVKKDGADLGIAFDGDADRVGLVDQHGRILWGDEMLVLFARDILAERPGAVIVSEVKCSQRLYDAIAQHGGQGIMWKAGHSLFKAKMRETKAALAAVRAHLRRPLYGYDDGIRGVRMLQWCKSGANRSPTAPTCRGGERGDASTVRRLVDRRTGRKFLGAAPITSTSTACG
jgi:phosphomannomutase